MAKVWAVHKYIWSKKIKAGTNYADEKELSEQIEQLSRKTDYFIVTAHIGRVFHKSLSAKEKDYLKSLKADLVVVHHAHIAQSKTSKNIISCGDFIFRSESNDMKDNRNAKLVLFGNKGIKCKNLKIRNEVPHYAKK